MVADGDIIRDNPWWRGSDWVDYDPEITAWMRSKLQIVPRIMHKIIYDFEPDNSVVYTLRGTRQIGKTTMIKLQIHEFLKKGTSPWNILYYSFDLCKTPSELVDVVESYNRLTRRMWDKGRHYIFLDEVSTIPHWQKGIKWLKDRNRIANSTIMATGSDAIDLQRSIERLPGRRGSTTEHHDKILLPLKFAEYASAMDSEIRTIVDSYFHKSKDRLATFGKLAHGEVDRAIDLAHMHQHSLDDILSKYMYSGGIPFVVNAQASTLPIRENVYSTYMDSIMGEWSRLGRDNNLLKRIGKEVVESQGSHASWNNMAKNADVGSPKTVQDSVQTLSNLFVLLTIYGYNMDSRSPMFHRNKKIYFVDPFFFHMFNGWTASRNYFDASSEYLDSSENKSVLIESIVANHLTRLAFNVSPSKQNFDHHYRVFYHMEKGREVDFVYDDGGKMVVPIEVKYRNRARRDLAGMYQVLNKTRGKGLVISKDRLDISSEYVMVPASLFLLLA